MPIEGQNPELARLAEDLCKDANGITMKDAQAKGICVSCKEPALPKCYSDAGRKEYQISGMCETCFDELFKDDGDEDYKLDEEEEGAF